MVASSTLIKVPDVRFKPLAIAKQEIAAKGLQIVEKEPELADASVAPGNVKRQTPEKDTEVPPNSTVELVVAAVPKPVPQLVGKRIAEAQLLLQQQSLKMGTVWGTYNEGNASTVLITGQTPVAGTQVAQGSNVNVNVPCIGLGCRIILLDRVDRIKILRTRSPIEMRRQE